jgi:hypothetical protein
MANLTKLTADQLARLRSWWGTKDPYAPQYVSQEAWSEYAEAEWPVEELIATLQRLLAKIPEAERSTARIVLNEGHEGGGSISLLYTREKTDAEKQVEIDRALAWLNECDERERQEFARLSAKYSKSPSGV